MAEQGAGFQKLLIAFVFIGLFSVLLVGWAINLGEEYGDDYGQNPEYVTEILGVEDIEGQIESTKAQAEGWQDTFAKTSVFNAIAGTVVKGIFELANFMFKAITVPFDLLGNIFVNVLGIPPFVISIFAGLLILAVMFAIWRLIKIGY